MRPGSSLSTSTSGRFRSSQVVVARCASCVHSALGSWRARKRSPRCSISASLAKSRGEYSVIGRVLKGRARSETGRSGGGGLAGRGLRLLPNLGRCLPDAFVDLIRELGEILDEQVDELRGHCVILGGVR